MSTNTCLSTIVSITMLIMSVWISFTKGGCQFKASWKGRWFQSGVQNLLLINSTHIESKGECFEEQGDKYLLFDRSESCYRCMVIHEKHPSVLQYKETYCETKASLQEVCYGITGDAALYSMFRKHPEAKPVPCPFKSAPFTFTYNRGFGDCINPPSKAESCTDDSRLVLKYQACPDVPSSESNVEELVCLATWKEGSTKYLIGRISQIDRRALTSDEDQYRCFIYQREKELDKTIYSIAQSGDATCNGLQSAFEGSRNMRLKTVDNNHFRCKFPKWIIDHHTWVSLDHRKIYKFTQRNATLKILDEEKPKPKKTQNFAQAFPFQEFGFESQDQKRQNSEMRVVCHGILESQDQKKVQIVAHITAGCDSGYVCMVFYKRDHNVIEIQQSDKKVENPDDACSNFNVETTPYTTLITTKLHPKNCPHFGRYIVSGIITEAKRKKRQEGGNLNNADETPDCLSHDYQALSMGCSRKHEVEFKSTCPKESTSAYSCHGSWEENGMHYLIASKKSNDILRFCFIYSIDERKPIVDGLLKFLGPTTLRLSEVSETCHRNIVPGVSGNWALNFTSNGTCTEDSISSSTVIVPAIIIVAFCFLMTIALR